VGFIFVVYLVGIVASAWIGSIADRAGRRLVLASMAVVMLAGIALTALRPLPLVIAGVAVVTFGFFGGHSVASSWVGLRATHAKAQAAALYLFFYYPRIERRRIGGRTVLGSLAMAGSGGVRRGVVGDVVRRRAGTQTLAGAVGGSGGLMRSPDELCAMFDRLGLAYERHRHAPVHTCEEAEAAIPAADAVQTKNLFMRDKRGRRHLRSCDVRGRRRRRDSPTPRTRPPNWSPDRLMRHLGVGPGSVTVSGRERQRPTASSCSSTAGLGIAQWRCHPAGQQRRS
jgi:hypothetical protein